LSKICTPHAKTLADLSGPSDLAKARGTPASKLSAQNAKNRFALNSLLEPRKTLKTALRSRLAAKTTLAIQRTQQDNRYMLNL